MANRKPPIVGSDEPQLTFEEKLQRYMTAVIAFPHLPAETREAILVDAKGIVASMEELHAKLLLAEAGVEPPDKRLDS